MKKLLIAILWVANMAAVTPAMAADDDTGDQVIPALDDQAEKLSIDADAQEMEGYSFDDTATQNTIEAKDLNKDITHLKKKIGTIQAQKTAAENRAKRASANLETTKEQKKALDAESKKYEAMLTKTEDEVSRLEKQLAVVKQKKANAEDRTKKAKDSYHEYQQQKSELAREQRKLSASIDRETRLKKNLDKKRVAVQSEVYKLKGNVARMRAQEKRLKQQNENSKQYLASHGRHKGTLSAKNDSSTEAL